MPLSKCYMERAQNAETQVLCQWLVLCPEELLFEL